MNACCRLLVCSCIPFVSFVPGAGAYLAADGSTEAHLPLPTEEERAPRNDAELRAGAVVLDSLTEISGTLDPEKRGSEGEVRRLRRLRYLVFDDWGAQRLSRHAFFERQAEETATRISGRTITADGQVFPLDPEKDVRDLDTRDFEGKPMVSRRTVFFPHVQSGAVLELSYSTRSQRLPTVEVVSLQQHLPVRRAVVKTKGKLQRGKTVFIPLVVMMTKPGVYWVPFFLGPSPPNAVAHLDREFNLNLEVIDLPPLVEEPYSPPVARSAYMLGLVPRVFSAAKEVSAGLWRKNRYLFGPPASGPSGGGGGVTRREIDPADGIVQLDELGLQPLPHWKDGSHPMLEPFQKSLKGMNVRFIEFMGRRPSKRQRKEIAAIAPEELGWRERAHRIYCYVRENVQVDAEADDESRPATILRKGLANSGDVALLVASLLNQAGISSRLLYGLNRNASPFQPAVWHWGLFRPFWIVEAGGEGEPHLFLSPSDRYASFDFVPISYLGGLAFAQPPEKKSPWPLIRIPADLAGTNSTQMRFSAPLDPGRREVRLVMRSVLEGTAASRMRWRTEYTAPDETPEAAESRKLEALRAFVDQWTNLEFTGQLPERRGDVGVDEPFRLEVEMAWRPEIQDLGGSILLPAFPNAGIFQNVFTEVDRASPIWLPGGTYDLSMEWRLPEGVSLENPPERLVREGPGDLELEMWVEEQAPGTPISRMRINLPYMLPASDYLAVKQFYEELQRAGRSQLLAVLESDP